MADSKSTRNAHVPGYSSWQKMRYRCYNPRCVAYADYGGRGITVCDQWRTFKGFLRDMGPKPSPQHSIDRFPNSDGNYEPGNCRWATRKEQSKNRRTVRHMTFNGRTQTMTDWAKELGIDKRVLSLRLTRLGWTEERTLSMPKRPMKPRRTTPSDSSGTRRLE